MYKNTGKLTDSIKITEKHLIVLPDSFKMSDKSLFEISVKRISEYGGCFDIIYGQSSENFYRLYDMVIILGLAGSREELDNLLDESSKCVPDMYIVKTIGSNPATVAVAGSDSRGMLYAAYCFADILKSGNEVDNLNICRIPKIKDRYVSLNASTFAGLCFRPVLFYETLHELPRYGYNGVVLVPGGQSGVPVDRDAPPVIITDNGEIKIDKFKLPEWKGLFEDIGKYGMDIALSIAPLIPAGFDDDEIDEFYRGGREPEGYLSALSSHFEKFLEVILETYGEIDMLIFSSTEGAEYGRCKRFFLAPGNVDKDSKALSSFIENNARIVRTYFDVFNRICGRYGVKAGLWTHIFGIVSQGLIKMREILFEYPEIINIEDDYWNNNLWIFDLPVMNYLPEDFRAVVPEKSRFAMVQWCTDAEYYGGGSLPNSYPDTLIYSAREAVRLGACMLMQRINIHDRTITGTLFNSIEIIPFAASRQVWDPVPDTDELWNEWAVRRYGKDASGHVVKALKNSKDIILKGLQVNGIYLIMHSAILDFQWMTGCMCFNLFGRRGKLFVPKTYDDVIFSGEYFPFQMKSMAVPMDEFRKNNGYALEKVFESRDYIEKARSFLSDEDYAEFRQIFDDAEIVLGALKFLGEAAYAANLVQDNFDAVKDPAGLLEKALEALEKYNNTVVRNRGDDLMYPSAYDSIMIIAASYRKLLQ